MLVSIIIPTYKEGSNIEFFFEHKILALMVGAVAGLGFNFMFSRLFIFRYA